jgi:ribosomal protein S18 acetylase RimI-like enzyme
MIRIRKARIDDVAYIAEGIYHAFLLKDKALYDRWIRTLKEVCAQEDTHYSYRNTWIAEVGGERSEKGGERAGMMIAVDGRHYREQRDKMYPQLKGLFDVAFGKGWDDMEDEAKAGEFYIDSLAVSLPYRNQGVGTALIEKAKEARDKAYAPYSGFSVGAALICADGAVYTGANIENASYTPTVCAERVAFFNAVHEGHREFTAIAIVGGKS